MANVSIPHTFVQNTPARASEVNDNFTAVVTQVNGNIDSTNLATGAVTEAKLAPGAVTTSRILNLAVSTAKIADGAVENSKIASLDAGKVTTGTFPNNRLANMASQTIKGRLSSGSGAPEDLTKTQMQNFLELSTLIANAVPSGIISMWSGSIASIPSGWALCNGSNGTPDLRDRFVVGAGSSYNPGDTGGSNTVTLNNTQIPSHTHTVSGNTDIGGSHSHGGTTGFVSDHSHNIRFSTTGGVLINNTVNGTGNISAGSSPYIVGYSTIDGPTTSAGGHSHVVSSSGSTHSHSLSLTSGATGGGQSHENRPPYYALAYIMKL